MEITEAGQASAHFPQPIHFCSSGFAYIPLYIEIAFTGHTFSQHPQATHSLETLAFFFGIYRLPLLSGRSFKVLVFGNFLRLDNIR